MATVHIGRLVGPAGFARTVAIKRLHQHLAQDPHFVASFVDEARLAACIRHPNVVPTLDVVVNAGEILVVMEYVQGESLNRLLRGGRPPLPIIGAIASQMLSGLHAAHEATSPNGKPLKLVHRDVSPQNVVVGTDGVARLLDFGVAKASWRMQDTRDGSLKGKTAYMSPEQLHWRPLDRRADIFAASIVLWEALTGQRLFAAASAEATAANIMVGQVLPPSAVAPDLPSAVDPIVLRGLAADPDNRYATALEMALALEAVIPLATPRELGAWVEEQARGELAKRADMVRALEDSTGEEATSTGPVVGRDAGAVAASTATAGSLSAARRVSRRRRAWAVIGLVAITTLAAVAATFARSSRKHAAGVVAAAAAPVAVAPDVPPVASSPAGLAPTASGEQPSAGDLQPAVSTATPRRDRPTSAKPPPGRTVKPRACDPPYTVGPDGVHRFRPECM